MPFVVRFLARSVGGGDGKVQQIPQLCGLPPVLRALPFAIPTTAFTTVSALDASSLTTVLLAATAGTIPAAAALAATSTAASSLAATDTTKSRATGSQLYDACADPTHRGGRH